MLGGEGRAEGAFALRRMVTLVVNLNGRLRGGAASWARRPPCWREFEPLDVACAAALGVEPQQLRPQLVLVHGSLRSVAPAGALCPLSVVETFRGVVIRVYDPLRPVIEEIVREGLAQGTALSRANRQRLIETVAARLPVVEIWHDLLHYTDREHFIPRRLHRVRRMAGPDADQRRRHVEGTVKAPFADSFGVHVRGQLAAYADVALRGDCAASIGVFTEQESRGKGMARSVVSAATRAILKAGRIPLYSADETNLGSLAVCRALGYLKFGEDLYCFLAPGEERDRAEQARRDAELDARDVALQRWVID